MRPSLVGTHDEDRTVQGQIASRFNIQVQPLMVSAPGYFKIHAGKPPCRPVVCVLHTYSCPCFSDDCVGNKVITCFLSYKKFFFRKWRMESGAAGWKVHNNLCHFYNLWGLNYLKIKKKNLFYKGQPEKVHMKELNCYKYKYGSILRKSV